MIDGRISISDTRRLANEYDDGDPLRDALLLLIDSAESLRRVHDEDCGCDEPASPLCVWPHAHLLSRFDFDEEVECR